MSVDTGIRRQLARLAMLTGLKTLVAELQTEIRDIEELQVESLEVVRAQLPPSVQAQLPSPPQGTPPTEDEREAIRLKRSRTMKANWKRRKALGLGRHGKIPPDAEESVLKSGSDRMAQARAARWPGNKSHKSNAPHIGFGTNSEWLYSFASEHDGILNTKAARAEAAALGHTLGYANRITVVIAEMKRKGLLKTSGPGQNRLTPLAHQVWRKERKNERQTTQAAG